MSQRFLFHTHLFLEHFPFQWAIQFALFCNESGTFWAAATGGCAPARAAPTPSTPSPGHFSSITAHRYIKLCAKGISAPRSSHPGASHAAQLRLPPQRAFPAVQGPSALPGAAGQSPGLEEIQHQWIVLSVSNSADFKYSKRTYFALLERTPQLTIL